MELGFFEFLYGYPDLNDFSLSVTLNFDSSVKFDYTGTIGAENTNSASELCCMGRYALELAKVAGINASAVIAALSPTYSMTF